VTGFEIEYKDAATGDEDTEDALSFVFHHFIRAFDLSQAPLLRVGLIKIKKDRHIFLVDMHHIISDGISSQVLVEEISALYAGNELPGINIQYKDYAEWQKSENSSKKLIEQGEYWKKEYEGDIPVLELPTDYIRPVIQGFAGNSLNFELKDKTSATLKTLALETGSTLYIVLLALYNIFLSRLSNREDIIIGSPVAGRRHVDLEKIIGMFVNTLPLRNYPSGEKIFADFLHEVKESTLKSFENQEYLYEDMVDQLSLSRDTGRNPLFDTMFVLQNTGSRKIALPGLKLIPYEYEYESKTAKFDLTLIVVEEEQLHFTFEYNIKLFNEVTVRKFITYFINIIEGVVESCRKKISDFEIITEEEKSQILFDFNNTKREYPADKTIHYLFAEQSAQRPDYIALHGCMIAWMHDCMDAWMDGEVARNVSLTYHELNEQSDRLAGLLIEKGVLPGSIVAIMLDRSIELITGIMGILKAGAVYMPIDIEYPEERVNYMLKDSHAKILIINKSEIRNPKLETNPNNQNLNDQNKNGNFEIPLVLNFENLNFEFVSCFDIRASNLIPSNLAYIIYTSGSTGKPKGVIVSHRNVVRLVKNTNFVPLNRETRILQTGAPVFDATTLEIWGSLLNGGQLVLTDKETIMDAYHLAGALSRNRINTLWLSAPLFNQLSEENLELFSPLKYVLVGGDVLSPAHINRVKQRLPGLSIINGYGPTENTTFSTTYLIEKEFEQNIPIGRPIANSTAYISDKNNRLVPVGVVGELLVGGDGAALGYLNNPELTSEKFILPNHHSPLTTHHSPLYKTGDLSKWLPDGNIQFLGRIDQQVKIRGFRVELEEIENHLLKFGKIKETVVIPIKGESGDKTLAAYIVWNKAISTSINELNEYLQRVLPDYMIPSHIMELEKLPLTVNGKIDPKLLPSPGLEITKSYAAPRNETEKKLVKIWSQILGAKQEIIGIEDSFFQLGGHSLKAMLMVSRIQKEFKVKLPLAEIFKRSTIKGIAEFIKRSRTVITIPIAAAAHRDYYTLSAAQRRMYLLYRLDETSTVYNMPAVLLLAGKLEVSRFEKVLKKLIQRHESFRTSFELINEAAVQRIHDEVAFEIEYLATDACGEHGQTRTLTKVFGPTFFQKGGPPEAIIKSFIRPFDLSCASLLRVGLFEQEENRYLLLVDMHHIISDGMSMGIFVREFMALYAGEELPALEFQYKDYAEWQQGAEVKKILKGQENYWLEQFENEIPVLNLPTDFIRPKVQSFEGRSIGFEIGPVETTQLKQLALEQNSTLYMILLAAFGIFLAKISGQEDIVIGTPTAGRGHIELESIIGMFVNTLALRHFPQGEKNFAEFLRDVTGRTLAAFENQDYPFEDLVEKVVQDRDMGRNPLFEVMFVLQNMEISEITVPGLELSAYPYENNTAKFDITLSGFESDNGLHFNFEYCSKLFEATTIHRFIGFFKKIIFLVLENPGIRVSDIEIISEDERKQILIDFNDTDRTYPAYKDISHLFEEQVEKIPDYIALHGCMIAWMDGEVGATPRVRPSLDVSLTYHQLNEQSNNLAGLLIEKGVLPDNIVGIMVERSIEMIIGIFGILKAGGAYLPIAPQYPQERIDYMLKDSNAKILINKSEAPISKYETNPNVQKINDQNENFKDLMVLNLDHLDFEFVSNFGFRISDLNSSNLAYIIYTSGSTGRPKGVMVEQGNLVNLVEGLNRDIYSRYDQTLNICLIAPFIFDASIKQIFAALLLGNKLSIVPEKARLDGMLLLKYLIKYKIDISDGTPSYLRLLTESITKDLLPSDVKYFIIGGEALTREITEGFFAKFSGKTPRIINIYGPTECTVDTTFFEISPANIHLFKLNIPIGKPLSNCRVYIINKYQQLQPIGIPGELLVSGNGVGRGYLSNPEMTCEKFVFDPFVKGNRMNHSRMYRTGDLARRLPNGNIEFLGRIDFQVKIRGFRIELGEIENYLLKFGKIKEALVIPVEDEPGEKNLAAYIVWDKEISFSINDLKEYLQTVLPGYMIPGYIIELEKLPLSINGKIDRKLLPAPTKKSENRHTAPRDEIDKKLTDIWAEILRAKSEIIGIDDNFFQLGGHSLKAAIMTAKVHKALHVEIPLSRVFETPTIRALSTYINETREKKYDPVEILPESKYYELSSAQKRLYILQQMGLGSTGYNMPIAMRLLGELDAGKLEKIFKELINRHESLRTSFKTVGDRPMQKINAEIDFKIGHYRADTSGCFDISHFVRVFDLSCAPLVRVGLVKISPNEHIVMIDMHHIIADGTSLAIFYKEMMALYQGDILPSLKITYKDYAAWQNNQKNKEILDRQGKFWLEQFAEDIPVLNLPIDYSRPVMQSFEGNRVDFELSREETELLKRVAQSQGATLYMAILAACNTWLSKLSGEADIVIGSPVAGRNREEFQEIIGMFVNTLPLRNYPAPGKTFAGFLKEIKERTLTALENQDYPFEDLVEKIVGTRDTSRNPIFDVMFVFQNMDVPNIDIPGLMLRPYDYEIKTSKFDLNLAGMEIEDRISFSLEYSTTLFKEETIRRFAGYFKNIIQSINLNPVIKLTEIEIIDPEEKKRILEISNGVTGAIDLNETIHGWFEKIVPGNEHKTALVFRDGRITYGELNRRANQLAFLLQSLEVGPGKVVGLMVGRSFEMIIGMLAIMKAGGAYLPIDPKLPGPRKQFMIENANISALLTNFDLEKNTDYLPGDIKPYDLRNAHFYQGTGQNPPLVNKGSDPVYVLFTSGSTGRPKGVMLQHTNLVNLIQFQHKYTDIDCSKVLQFTTISFDVSFQEIFTALTGVGELYLITQETREHISQLFNLINKNKIKTLFFPMSFIKLIFSQDDYLEMFPGSITHIVTAGEQVIVSDRFRNYLKQHQIYFHNHYGPSETHVVTTLTMNPNEDIPEFPSIGKPIMNTCIYILDKGYHLQPVGIAGELAAGGLQVGSGYLNNPEITADKFRPLIMLMPQISLIKNE
ncbi:MAG: amino acid adenylation domain-containing protein, partial [Acidobacteria bacterium]|nr:amino acid adenylation domain-containing protein [Acidobacteriota bacterium]